jgi:hypothetical protein
VFAANKKLHRLSQVHLRLLAEYSNLPEYAMPDIY